MARAEDNAAVVVVDIVAEVDVESSAVAVVAESRTILPGPAPVPAGIPVP